MNCIQAFRQAIGRSGLNGVKIERLKIMSRPTYSRKIRDPSQLTLRELRMLDKEAHFTDEELRALIRS